MTMGFSEITVAESDESIIKPHAVLLPSDAACSITDSESQSSHADVVVESRQETDHEDCAETEEADQEDHDDDVCDHVVDEPQHVQEEESSSAPQLSPRHLMKDVTFAEPSEIDASLESCDSEDSQDESKKQAQQSSNPLQLNEEYTKRVLKYAQRRLDKSHVQPYYNQEMQTEESMLLLIPHQELKLGHMLGQGSFSAVYSVKKAGGNRLVKSTLLEKDQIVVKVLRKKLLQKPAMLAACIADLIKEGLLLAALTQEDDDDDTTSHTGKRHILKVHGWTPTLLDGFHNGRHDAFFLILQKLDYTLSHKLEQWRRQRTVDVTLPMVQEQFPSHQKKIQPNKSLKKLKFWKKAGAGNGKAASVNDAAAPSSNPTLLPLHISQLAFWQDRLQLIIDLSHAVEYLHSKRILHRDLKPDNIGFEDPNGLTGSTTAGVLKVFDFDVARILPEVSGRTSSSSMPLFQLTKRVGSPRYMSPECARGDKYNEKADVYTVGLLCYEFLTLIKPYHDVSPEQHDDAIFHKGARPVMPPVLNHDKAVQVAAVLAKKMEHGHHSNAKTSAKQPHVQFWSPSMQGLVKRMWNQDIAQRPTMDEARRAMERECQSIQQQLRHLEWQVEEQLSQEQQVQDCTELDTCDEVSLAPPTQDDPALTKTATSTRDLNNKPTRGFSLRLWKSSSQNSSNGKLLDRSRHGSFRSRTSSMGGTSRTVGTTTGLSSNFASFNNLAAMNTLPEQQ